MKIFYYRNINERIAKYIQSLKIMFDYVLYIVVILVCRWIMRCSSKDTKRSIVKKVLRNYALILQ